MRLHDGEVRATTDMVRALLADQRPEGADLTITPVDVALEGTDHVMYRLGDSLVARFPKLVPAADQDKSDAGRLERLAPQLPVAAPCDATPATLVAATRGAGASSTGSRAGRCRGWASTTRSSRPTSPSSPEHSTRSTRPVVRARPPAPEERRSTTPTSMYEQRWSTSAPTTTLSTSTPPRPPGASRHPAGRGNPHGCTRTSSRETLSRATAEWPV